MREFETGATRNSDTGKLDYEGFLSPVVLEAYAEYMNRHRTQEDGKLRDSDNWQKGFPQEVYMKSLWRHFMDVWKEHRGIETEAGLEAALCAVIFNAMGMLYELIKVSDAADTKAFEEFGQGTAQTITRQDYEKAQATASLQQATGSQAASQGILTRFFNHN